MAGEFSERARQEADRYGADPWIFVRELLQNARDAGARSVTFTTGEQDGLARLHCRDDGEGMSFEHARKFLFTLYASSKEGKADEAGRFGVGFWSVLRFEPSRILVRSWPKDGSEPWEIELAGGLTQAVRQPPPPPGAPGTEIVLERARGGGDLAQVVADTAWQVGRFLTCKGDRRRPLGVTVDGKAINEPFALPAPSVSFQKGRLRGVVGLGPAPRIELFSKGLRVRSAVALEDLLSPPGRTSGFARLHFPPLADGLAPQALLECEDLEVLLSRRDARDTPALRRLVRLAQRELERLIEEQIDLSHPEPWWRRTLGRFGVDFSATFAVTLVLCLLALGGRTGYDLWRARHPAGVALLGYRDVATRYGGPRTNVADEVPTPPPIRYSPAEASIHLAAFEIETLEEQGRPRISQPTGRHYRGTPCTADCVELEVPIDAGPGVLRLPVPTGHRLDLESVRLDESPIPGAVLASSLDEPYLLLRRGGRATLRYRTGPAAPLEPPAAVESPAPLPAFAEVAPALRQLPPRERVAGALRFVHEHVAYSTSREAAEAFQQAAARGIGFVERSLRIGAGDCDVQNGVLLMLLQQVGIPARMAGGYVGRGGALLPAPHAWVEYGAGDGRWHVLDATEGSTLADSATEEMPAAVSELSGGTDPEPIPPGEPTPAVALAPTPVPASVPDEARATHQARAPVEAPAPAEAPAPTEARTTHQARAPAEASAPAEARAPAEAPAPAEASAPAEAPGPRARADRDPGAPGWKLDLAARWRSLDLAAHGRPLAALALLWVAGILALSRRVRSFTRLDPGHDLSKLLRGALENPGAYGFASAIELRRIIPCLGGRAISLSEARTLADRGRLYSTGQASDTARVAARDGAVVLEVRRPEAAVVARALGAVDLDACDALLERGSVPPLLRRINEFLKGQGELWWAFSAPELAGSSRIYTLPLRSWGFERELRYVAIDAQAPWLIQAIERFGERPREAMLAALDRLVELQGMPEPDRARLLAPLARLAVEEAALP